MYSGKFNRRIVILRATRTADAPNEWLDTWSRLAIVAAKRMDASATDTFWAADVAAQIRTRFTIRYTPQVADVSPQDRIAYVGRGFDIVAVRETVDGRNRCLELDAVARADPIEDVEP